MHATTFIQMHREDAKKKTAFLTSHRKMKKVKGLKFYNDLTSLYFSLVQLELQDLHQHFLPQSTGHHTPPSDQRAPDKAKEIVTTESKLQD
jgi:hypothetical protein